MKIPEEQRQAYLNHALDITPQEHDKIKEYSDWLPPVIIDVHAHSNLPEHAIDISSKAYNHMLSTFPGYTGSFNYKSMPVSARSHQILF